MKVHIFDLANPITLDTPITACIGYFDGLHIGHQKLIEHVLCIAKESNTIPALITFDPDPWVVLHHLQAEEMRHITPMKHRIEIGESLGLQEWIILKFKEDMAHISYEDFHRKVLQPLRIHTLVCGFDFHYAHKGEGDIHTLRKQDQILINVVEEVSSDHRKISSSYIEDLIQSGDVEQATRMMGRCYEMRGRVKRGNHMGTGNGYPTANLAWEVDYLVPKQGVYTGSVQVAGTWYKAIMNVGHNPTFNYQEQMSIEAHILDFNEMIYDQEIRFRFHQFLRGEQKFSGPDALIVQLTNDEQRARSYFNGREEELLCD